MQKPIFRSDQFNQRDSTKTNGLIAFVQGVKTGQKAKSSVRPKIRVTDTHAVLLSYYFLL